MKDEEDYGQPESDLMLLKPPTRHGVSDQIQAQVCKAIIGQDSCHAARLVSFMF